MRKYEVMILFSSDLTEEQVKKEVALLKSDIETRGGKVEFEDFWGKRKLAYSIKKHDTGTYQVLLFTLGSQAVKALDKEMHMHKHILRYLLTMPPKGYQPITAGEVEASEERHFAEVRTKKASGGRRQAKPLAPTEKVVLQTEPEKDSEDTAEERAKKLDKILSSDLNI